MKALKRLHRRQVDLDFIDQRIALLNRDRVALCAAIVNRRIEAARHVVLFSRWANGNGALNVVLGRPAASAAPTLGTNCRNPIEEARRDAPYR